MLRNFEIGFLFRNRFAISNLRGAISKLRKFANCAEHIRLVHKMALYKYFKKVPRAFPNPNGSLLGRMPSEAIPSANCEMSGSVHGAEQ